ncbi:MAG: hypothetical protein MJY87_03125 [Fibrobacter sp.]|nr:hypothetical protein [Fibrobacter sp.]
MSITVIFSDFGDTDTKVLAALWENIPDVKLLHITKNSRDVKRKMIQAMVGEKDTILFCGHGTSGGLLSPTWGDLVLSEENVRHIVARRVIGIWCHGAQFAESVGLKGFFSSMFISNIREAYMEGCTKSSPEVITEQEELFCRRVNRLLLDNVPLEKWLEALRSQADRSIDVVRFNYDGLRYFG